MDTIERLETDLYKIVDFLDDNMAENIIIYNVKSITDITDYCLIVTARTNYHIKSLLTHFLKKFKATHGKPYAVDGNFGSGWVVIDYVNFIVHIMLEEKRLYYNLDEMFGADNVVLR